MRRLTRGLIVILLCLAASRLLAQDLATPIAQPAAAVTASSNDSVPNTIGSQNPAQAEAEKAPVTNRPAEVPKFSLPDVVITGENELTIGAKRSESVENDVSWGAQNLTNLNRSTDDLPGLDKSLTALSTQETGPSQDTTLILHGGGGIPGTLGGWGLFGKDFTDMQYLLSGYYSTWGGEPTNGSFDGDQKYRFGGEFKLIPAENVNLRFSIYSTQVDATLPYQNAIQEIHQGLDINANLNIKLSNVWRSEVLFNSKTTTLNYWDQNTQSNQVQEFDGRVKLMGEEIDPFWNAFTLEAGGYQSNSNFSVAPNTIDNLVWANVQSRFNFSDNLDLNASIEGQSGSGPYLTAKLFPAVNLRWRFFEDVQITAYWKTARTLDGFYDTFMDKEHIGPESGLPTATENTGEWGARLTKKLDENEFLNVTVSSAQLQNYQQWTDVDDANPAYIETYSSVPSVELNRVIADFQWKLDEFWKTSWNYQWTQGINNSGNGYNLTFLPEHQGVVSLTRSEDQWDASLSLVVISHREGLETATLVLPAYATFNLSADYHLSREFSLWLTGDNLLGASYMLEPGYLEPQYHLRGGIEIIF